jgi:hypothetical protein
MKMVLIYFLLFELMSLHNLYAQPTFEKVLNKDGISQGYGAVQTFDGGYAIGGCMYANAITGLDLAILKIDSIGNIIWKKCYGDARMNFTGSGEFIQTADSGFVLLGSESDNYNNQNTIIKTNSKGDTLWTKIFTPDSLSALYINAIHQTSDGGYILTGTGGSFYYNYNINGIALIKLDANGNLRWYKIYTRINNNYSGGGYSSGYNAVETNEGDFVITACGPNESSFTLAALYLIKTDSIGSQKWIKELNIAAVLPNDGGLSFIQQADDEGYVLTAYLPTDYSTDSIALIKIDTAGKILWAKNYFSNMGSLSDINLSKTDNNGYILSGALFNTQQNGIYSHFIKINNAGDTLLTGSFGPLNMNSQFTSAVFETSNKGFFGVGATNSSNSYDVNQMLLVKTDSLGKAGCFNNYNSISINPRPILESAATDTVVSYSVDLFPWPLTESSYGELNDLCLYSGIKEDSDEGSFSLYPNPTNGIIYLSAPTGHNVSTVQVFDLMGREIISKIVAGNSEQTLSFDMSHYANGYYLMRICCASEIVYKRFVLQ